jgi:S-layer protein
VLDGSGTGQTVALWSGSGTSNTLTDAPITVSGNNTTFAGTINSGYITSTAGATFAGTVTTDGLFVNASATGNAKIVAADQAYARLAIDNLNGQEWNLIAGTAGASNSGFGIYDADAAATRLQITSAGNVGIGTTSPTGGALVVDVTAAAATADISAQATGTIAFSDNGANEPAIIGKSTANNTNGLYIVAAASDTNSDADFQLNVREERRDWDN